MSTSQHLDFSRVRMLVPTPKYDSCHIAHIGDHAKRHVKAFKLDRATGLNRVDAGALVEDFIEVQVASKIQRDKFEKAQRRALLLPQCARSHMDKRCMADFKADVSTHEGRSCRESCLISMTTALGKAKGCDVYVIPGGTCSERILKGKKYDGVVGVACGMELKMGLGLLKKLGIPGQGIFLTKNGCSNTSLNLQNLARVL